MKEGKIKSLYFLHILNDGFLVSLPLLLPFVAKSMSINLAQVGLLGTLLNLLGVFLALPAGYLGSRIGGFRVLIIAVFLYSLGFFGTYISSSVFLLYISFFAAGTGFGIFHPISFALISRWSSKENRGRLMGNFTAIGDIGRIIFASAITYLITYIGWKNTSLAYGVAAATVFSFVFFKYFISKKEEAISIKQSESKFKSVSFVEFVRNKRFMLNSLTAAIDSLASSALFIFLPFLLTKRGVESSVLGSFTAAFFVGNMMGKTILGRLVDKFGNTKVFIVSEALMALFIFLLANTPSIFWIVVFSVILGAFTKGTAPVIQTMIAESVEHHGDFEKAFGVKELISGIANTAAPGLLGFISYKYGIITAFNVSAIFALVAIIPAILARRHTA